MISVVIPLFNKAHTISKTLDTVLKQTFGSFEVIVVNDGSSDNSVEVLQSFTNDSRIKIINQNNQGVSAARNKGVELATYDYIAFLDGDDEWMPNYLQKMVEVIRQFPHAGMYCCGGQVRNSDGSTTIRVAKKYKGEVLVINFFENPHVFLHTSATIVLKSEFSKTKGFPLGMKRNQDFALFYSLALITPVVYCGLPLSVYVGGVTDQATATPIDQVLKYVVDRYNITYLAWSEEIRNKKPFIVFMKYELRHLLMVLMIDKKYEELEFLLNNIDKRILEHFGAHEIPIYKVPYLRLGAISLIKLTKLRWRMRGYPYVGQI